MQQLKEHNSKGMRLQEILRYMKRDLSHYSWCLITLRILREKAPSNKIPALTKSMNMGIWVVGISNQLFIRDS